MSMKFPLDFGAPNDLVWFVKFNQHFRTSLLFHSRFAFIYLFPFRNVYNSPASAQFATALNSLSSLVSASPFPFHVIKLHFVC